MKKIFVAAVIVFFAVSAYAQTPYLKTKEGSDIILNGIITKYALLNDSSFKWYGTNQNAYNADPAIVNSFEAAKNQFQFVIFGGTWCEDTQFILPRFFKLQEKSGFPDKSISFFAVDRQKHTVGNIEYAFKVTNVPTIIVMKDGKEVGRVVEYGKTGKWDQEIAQLLK